MSSNNQSIDSSCSSLSTGDIEQFKRHIGPQLGFLYRAHQETAHSLTVLQSASVQHSNEVMTAQEAIKATTEKSAHLMKCIAKITDENGNLKKAVEELKKELKNLTDEQRQEIMTTKTMIESLRTMFETQLNGVKGGGGGGLPSNFAEVINALDQQMGSYDVKLAETDLRFQILETTNYDGKLIWKIKSFHRRQADARRGATLSIYSQPFYTSRYGYKLCLRAYLNGDGIGRNTHISLFVVLMKGEYDALLPFPFKQKVSLFLLDQSSQRRHLTDTFRPDPTSSSFKRPNSDMNIASGCPMFVSHDTLNNGDYMVEDTIFIKAIIDTTDLENF